MGRKEREGKEGSRPSLEPAHPPVKPARPRVLRPLELYNRPAPGAPPLRVKQYYKLKDCRAHKSKYNTWAVVRSVVGE